MGVTTPVSLSPLLPRHQRRRLLRDYIAKNFGISVDDIIYFNEKNSIPNEVSVEDKATLEQLQLINELEEEEKTILLKLIETFVSKKRFKDYLQKNIASL